MTQDHRPFVSGAEATRVADRGGVGLGPLEALPAEPIRWSGGGVRPREDWRAIGAVITAQLGSEGLQALLDELDGGVLVCQSDGTLLLANDAARRQLHRGGALQLLTEGRLLPGHDDLRESWLQALAAGQQGRRRQLLQLRERDGRPLLASVIGLPSVPAVLVLLGRRQSDPVLAVQMIGGLYGLTTAEQQVLDGLLAGRRIEALAAERGVKVSTLRTQVASLRAKMGASRIEDLLRIVGELPPIMGALRSPPLHAAEAPQRSLSGGPLPRGGGGLSSATLPMAPRGELHD